MQNRLFCPPLFLRRIFQFSQAIISLTGGVAMTVVYLDSVFLFNALIDYLLVLAAALCSSRFPAGLRLSGGCAG